MQQKHAFDAQKRPFLLKKGPADMRGLSSPDCAFFEPIYRSNARFEQFKAVLGLTQAGFSNPNNLTLNILKFVK